MKGFFKRYFHNLLERNSNPTVVAKTVAVGLFISFSPYLGLQTWLAFPLSWIFKVEAKLVIFILYSVNNPWTMIPIIALDYWVGKWITGLLGIDLTPYNPGWMKWINQKLSPYLMKYLGITELSLWNYIIGGNIVALLVSIGLYPLIKRACVRIYENHLKHKNSHENHHAEQKSLP